MPKIPKDLIEPDQTPSRLVGRTQNISEAEQIAQQYEMQGFSTKIVKKGQMPTVIYEVWASKKKEGFMQMP
ncbi:hypothetical protein HY988_01500 [Candidatus Micrarchaeota archaeon]|nr:hypothetical protein [Candidatus Micrarchaeota archaeon]